MPHLMTGTHYSLKKKKKNLTQYYYIADKSLYIGTITLTKG